MSDWHFAQADPTQQLAKLQYYSMMKSYDGREVEIVIAVKEFYTPKDPAMTFFAQADKQINQKVAHRAVLRRPGQRHHHPRLVAPDRCGSDLAGQCL